jgi:diaminopimelate decarboxylase
MDFFEYKNKELFVENVSLKRIAEEVGTPSYVYSKATFTRHLTKIGEAFKNLDHLICYSVKVASNLSLLKIVNHYGFGADIVSGGELFRALKAGIPGGRIVFSGVGKTAKEMAEALDAGILMFNVESAEEMELLSEVAANKGLKAPLSFRVNPDVDPKTHSYVATGLKESKFGIPMTEALALYSRAALDPNLKIMGIDCHIGSQLTEISPFVQAAERLKILLRELKKQGQDIRYFDIGGGLGINYNQETPPSLDEYAKSLAGVLKEFSGLTLVMEPGRLIAGNSAILLIEVLFNKNVPEKNFVIVNGAMNDLIRPSLYGSWHDIWPVTDKCRPKHTVNVVGPICESGDFLAKGRELAEVKNGEFLAVKSAGAYGFSMSSNYNSRPRASEVLVDGDTYTVIRARESYEDLIKGESF